jgi:hypothetical protein
MSGIVVEMDGKPYRFPVARAEVDPSDLVNPAWMLDGRRDDTFRDHFRWFTKRLGSNPSEADSLTYGAMVAAELLAVYHPEIDPAAARALIFRNLVALTPTVILPTIDSHNRACDMITYSDSN